MFDQGIDKDSTLNLVLHLHRGVVGIVNGVLSLSKHYSFKDAMNRNPSVIVPIHLSIVYIVEKLKEDLILEVNKI
jgi:hypothetical protein